MPVVSTVLTTDELECAPTFIVQNGKILIPPGFEPRSSRILAESDRYLNN